MKKHLILCSSVLLLAQLSHAQLGSKGIPNPLIDYPTFLKIAQRVEPIRESRRVTEPRFLEMMSEPGIVLLDARSAEKYRMRHITGALNLSLPDFTAAELRKIIPSKSTKVLIYCNNNFVGSPIAFASKSAGASLNISTYVTLHTYGYTNVYELGPLLDVKTSKLPFEGTEIAPPQASINLNCSTVVDVPSEIGTVPIPRKRIY